MGAFLHPSLPSMLRQNVSPLRPELAYLARSGDSISGYRMQDRWVPMHTQ